MRGQPNKFRDAKQAPHAKNGSKAARPRSDFQLADHLLQTSWRIAFALLGPGLAGVWLDKVFDTKPVITILGVLLGLILVKTIVSRYVNQHFPDGGSA